MKDLRVLSLAKNRFTGTLPASFEQLDQLEALSLKDQVTKGGGLTGELLSFQSSPQLTNLILSGNKLEGSLPKELLTAVDPESVVTVDLASNVLTGVVPGDLTSFTNMNLYVQDNLISSIDDTLCKNTGWQGGLVGEYGCEAILCPEYTISAGIGRRQYDHQVCEACKDPNVKPILGQTTCGGKDEVLTERELLQLLFDTCNGAQWIRSESWGVSSEHICSWQGIDCDHAKSVVSIVLGMNNLKCDIPSQLWTLPNLERLNVLGNDVGLDFSGIEQATHLKELVLESTSIQDIDGIGFARGLIELNVNNNELKGTLPGELARLVGLVTLEVSHNLFDGSLPHWLEHLPKLERLYADWNRFDGTLPSFSELGELKLLNVSSNLLTGTLPTDFLNGLTDGDEKLYVDVSNNAFTGTLPAEWSNSVSHLHLDASNNKLTGVNLTLCSQKHWNGNDVDEFGCDGIVCPAGTFSSKGRQTAHSNPCEDCAANLYVGGTTCSSAWTSRSLLKASAISLFSAATAFLLLI
uniref:Leucine-rich repeat-containing N-terminal plant-type domain-containing protein n=1 Tax=Grammatophora oceanica TaxID=210454 RepID=A0A7S1YK18_9STRA